MAETATIHQINPSTQPSALGDKPKTPKIKLTKVLPTNRIGLDKQFVLLRAYAAAHASFNEPVSIRQVAGVAKMDRTGISLANGFLLDVGLLAKSGTGFIPTDPTIAFNHAYEWNAETAPQKLAGVLQKTWFAQKLTPLIMMGAISENDAIRELASESSAGPEHKGQLKIILEILEKSGVIKRENDSYVRGASFRKNGTSDVDSEEPNTPSVSAPEQREREYARETPVRSATTTTFNQMTAGAVQFSINVKVDMAEFAGWDPNRITAFFGGIAQVLAAKAKVEQDIKDA
jgi:hypothetical protein